MNRILKLIVFLCLPVTLFSQKEYFIYLQSESNQAFFVRMADQTFNSSPAGYLILSKLKDSTYQFKVGFPHQKWPDQTFKISVKAKDHGYLLKNFEGKGWGLFDLQSMNVQMAENSTAAKKTGGGDSAPVSRFTEVLAKAANDPGLREKPVYASLKEPVPATPAAQQPIPKNPTTENKQTEPEKTDIANAGNIPTGEPANIDKQTAAPKTDTVVQNAIAKNEEPEKKDSISSSTVASLDKTAGQAPDAKQPTLPEKRDTNTVAVNTNHTEKINEQKPVAGETSGQVKPDTSVTKADIAKNNNTEKNKQEEPPVSNQKERGEPEQKDPVAVNQKPDTPSADYVKSVVVKRSESSTTEGFGLTFIDKIADWRQDTIRILIPNPPLIPVGKKDNKTNDRRFLDITDEEVQPVVKKSTTPVCATVASQDDFFKLRKKMAGEKESEAMINEARKDFKAKCFTVEQIRNLGNLFLNEAGKFQFYEVAYPHSSDQAAFKTLEAEFRDPYFVHRFRNLIK